MWMLSLACLSILDSPTSPATHSALSLAGLCLWALVVCLLIFALYEAVSTVTESKSATRKTAPNPKLSPSSKSTPETNSEDKGFSRVYGTFLSIILVGSWVLWAGTTIRDHQKIKSLETQLAKYDASTVVQHNFEDFGQLDDGDFAYRSDEEPRGSTWRPCPTDKHNGVDTAKILIEGTGFIAVEARWEDRGICRSILRADLGFDWRTSANNFKYARGE
jgi:hypothetical protein